jgi:hypothetical protein
MRETRSTSAAAASACLKVISIIFFYKIENVISAHRNSRNKLACAMSLFISWFRKMGFLVRFMLPLCQYQHCTLLEE